MALQMMKPTGNGLYDIIERSTGVRLTTATRRVDLVFGSNSLNPTLLRRVLRTRRQQRAFCERFCRLVQMGKSISNECRSL